MKVTFWGTRGSIAAPGPGTVRYGGNTSCVGVVSDSGTLIVLDCGTGARALGDHLARLLPGGMHGRILLTHTHWDHIQGFPFFAPIFMAGNTWEIYGPKDGEHQLEQALSGQMQFRYFPVELEQISAVIHCIDLEEGSIQIDGVHVASQYLNHPAITLGYRLEAGGASLAYCTDHEPFSPMLFRGERVDIEEILHAGDRHHAEFFRGVDLLIHDAQYTVAEYEQKRNWGHSTIDYVVTLAHVAGVKHLSLFHHDPAHDDADLRRIEADAQDLAGALGGALQVSCAREGETIELRETARDSEAIRAGAGQDHLPYILVADDEPMVRELVRDILEDDSMYVLPVSTGEEVLARLSDRAPDLLLLDMRLPGIDGFEVLERIRAKEDGHELPVIMLTAVSDAEYMERGFRLGVTDYMTKPFTPAQLRARVGGWLRRAAQDSAGGS